MVGLLGRKIRELAACLVLACTKQGQTHLRKPSCEHKTKPSLKSVCHRPKTHIHSPSSRSDRSTSSRTRRGERTLGLGARPPWASPDEAPAPGPALGSSAALDANEQTASDTLLFADDAIFDIGDEDQNENAWAWPDTFGLGCCLAPEPTTPATPGVRFVSKGKRQRVPEDDRESGR